VRVVDDRQLFDASRYRLAAMRGYSHCARINSFIGVDWRSNRPFLNKESAQPPRALRRLLYIGGATPFTPPTMKPAARASSASRSAGGARASRSSDGSLARDPRGNESRADQRLSFPGRLAKPSPSPATAFEIQPTPPTASDRHSEIGRATKRTTRANLPNKPLLMSSATRPNKPTADRTRSRGSAN
jgi:hypothetical protein